MVDNINKFVAVISDNKETIKRKLIVGIGTAVGMLIASSVIDTFNKPVPEVIYIEVPADSDVQPETPTE